MNKKIIIIFAMVLVVCSSIVIAPTDWEYKDFNLPDGSKLVQFDDWGRDTFVAYVPPDNKNPNGQVRVYDAKTDEYSLMEVKAGVGADTVFAQRVVEESKRGAVSDVYVVHSDKTKEELIIKPVTENLGLALGYVKTEVGLETHRQVGLKEEHVAGVIHYELVEVSTAPPSTSPTPAPSGASKQPTQQPPTTITPSEPSTFTVTSKQGKEYTFTLVGKDDNGNRIYSYDVRDQTKFLQIGPDESIENLQGSLFDREDVIESFRQSTAGGTTPGAPTPDSGDLIIASAEQTGYDVYKTADGNFIAVPAGTKPSDLDAKIHSKNLELTPEEIRKINEYKNIKFKIPLTTTPPTPTATQPWKVTVGGNEYEFKSKDEAQKYINSLPAGPVRNAAQKSLIQGKVEQVSPGVNLVEIKDPRGKILGYSVSVGEKIVTGDKILSKAEAEKIIIVQQNRLIAEYAKKNQMAAATAYDENGRLLLVEGTGKNRKYYRANIAADGKISKGKQEDKIDSREEIGNNIVFITRKFDEKTGDFIPIKLNGVVIDQETLNEIKKAVGKNGEISYDMNKKIGIVVYVNGKSVLEIESNEKIIIRNHYKIINDISVLTLTAVYTDETRAEVTYEPIYYDKEGNIVTEIAYKKLAEEKNAGKIESFQSFASRFEIKDGERTPVEFVQWDTKYGVKWEDGKGTLEFVDAYKYDGNGHFKSFEIVIPGDIKDPKDDIYIRFDEETGEPIGYKIDDNENEVQEALSDELKELAKSAKTRATSRMWFSALEYVFTEFQGLGGYSSLFFSEEDLKKWRDGVDEAFNNFILGGTDYWSSQLCESQYDKSVDGVAFTVTPSGMLEAVAHVEAERSELIKTGEGTEYFYKITFYVKASDDDIQFNVVLSGERTVNLFSNDIIIEGDEDGDGEDYSATGERAVVQYSRVYYNKICLEFKEGGIDGVCNDIPVSDYSRDNYIKSGEQQTTTQGDNKITINQI